MGNFCNLFRLKATLQTELNMYKETFKTTNSLKKTWQGRIKWNGKLWNVEIEREKKHGTMWKLISSLWLCGLIYHYGPLADLTAVHDNPPAFVNERVVKWIHTKKVINSYQLLVIGNPAQKIESFVIGNAVRSEKLTRKFVDTPAKNEIS